MLIFGHVSRLFSYDPVYMIMSCRDLPECIRRMPDVFGITWLRQMDGHYQRVGMDGIHALVVANSDFKEAYKELGLYAAKYLS